MLSLTAQSQLADATAQMMRSCALAATRTWADTALRGLSLWSELMIAPGARTRPPGASPAREAEQASYSSYRSGGGHAVAQVIVAGEEIAQAWCTPTLAMLDAWRAAFGASHRN